MLKFKILSYSLLLFTFISQYGFAQSPEKELVMADSLYQKKQYISAIKIYNKIYESGNASPSMLLKLARIEEGMGNPGKSFYYLEKYYQLTKDEIGLDYLKENTEEENIAGFDYGFAYKLDLLYKEWKIYIQLLASILTFLFIGLMIKNREDSGKKKNYFAASILPIIILIFLTNYEGRNEAIITNNPSYLLEGPSSGANLVEQLKSPAKVKLKSEIDVWSKIIYDDKVAYIKSSQIKKL